MNAAAIHPIDLKGSSNDTTLAALCRIENATDGVVAIAAVLDQDAARGGTGQDLSAGTRGGLARAVRILANQLQSDLERIEDSMGYQRFQDYSA